MPIKINKNIIGVVLAGGKSKRFGKNKALQVIGNEVFIQKSAKLLQKYFSKVVISANNIEEYIFLQLPIIKDVFKNRGPLGGIYSVLKNEKQNIFVLACDLVFADEKLIQLILNCNTKSPIVFASAKGSMQPLCGIYKLEVLAKLEKCLHSKNYSVKNFISKINHKNIVANKFANKLININTFNDYLENVELKNGKQK